MGNLAWCFCMSDEAHLRLHKNVKSHRLTEDPCQDVRWKVALRGKLRDGDLSSWWHKWCYVVVVDYLERYNVEFILFCWFVIPFQHLLQDTILTTSTMFLSLSLGLDTTLRSVSQVSRRLIRAASTSWGELWPLTPLFTLLFKPFEESALPKVSAEAVSPWSRLAIFSEAIALFGAIVVEWFGFEV